MINLVHGDIRHLEKAQKQNSQLTDVHGDIRHLERTGCRFKKTVSVHGDIRHLEISTIPRELIL